MVSSRAQQIWVISPDCIAGIYLQNLPFAPGTFENAPDQCQNAAGCRKTLCCNNYVSVPYWALNACICVSGFWLMHCASLVDAVAPPTTTFLPERPQTANFCCLGQLGMGGSESLHLRRTVCVQAMRVLTSVTQAHDGTVSLQEGVFQPEVVSF